MDAAKRAVVLVQPIVEVVEVVLWDVVGKVSQRALVEDDFDGK